MKPNPTRSALLVIDMENGFVHPEGGHWIRFAQSTVPSCIRAVGAGPVQGHPRVLRQAHLPLRRQRCGADPPRRLGGRRPGLSARLHRPQQRPGAGGPAAPAGGLHHHQAPVERLLPDGAGPDPAAAGRADGDPHRHHHPQLRPHHLLRRHRPGVQRRGADGLLLLPHGGDPAGEPGGHGPAGAVLMDTAAFAEYGPGTVEDLSAAIRRKMLEEDAVPEPFGAESGRSFWPDLW